MITRIFISILLTALFPMIVLIYREIKAVLSGRLFYVTLVHVSIAEYISINAGILDGCKVTLKSLIKYFL